MRRGSDIGKHKHFKSLEYGAKPSRAKHLKMGVGRQGFNIGSDPEPNDRTTSTQQICMHRILPRLPSVLLPTQGRPELAFHKSRLKAVCSLQLGNQIDIFLLRVRGVGFILLDDFLPSVVFVFAL